MKKKTVILILSLLFLSVSTNTVYAAEQEQPTTIDATIIAAIIAAVVSVIGMIITLFNTRYTTLKPNSVNVLSEQYKKVFAPLHMLLFFSEHLSQEERKEAVLNCLTENYELVPSEIIECFNKEQTAILKIKENPDLKFESNYSFEELIDECYKTAKSKLGYTQTKMKYEAKITSIIASSKENTSTRKLLYAIFTSFISVSLVGVIICRIFLNPDDFFNNIIYIPISVFMGSTIAFILAKFVK